MKKKYPKNKIVGHKKSKRIYAYAQKKSDKSSCKNYWL